MKKDENDVRGSKEFKITDLPGVGAATAEKLVGAGYDTLLCIAVASPGEIVDASGVSELVARKIITVARDKLEMGFESGDELLKKREQLLRISTGSGELNRLFGGGVESSGITECYGQYGAGKSALAHQLAVNVQLPKEKGGVGGMTVWLDTESSLPYNEEIFITDSRGLRPVKIGQLVEDALNDTENITHFGETISTADNNNGIQAISYDPQDYKIKPFSITGFIKHKSQPVFEVKLASGRSVRVTQYHNFFTLNDQGDLCELATSELCAGKPVALAGKIPSPSSPFILDLTALLRDERGLYVSGEDSFKNFLLSVKEELHALAFQRDGNRDRAHHWVRRVRIPLDVFILFSDRVEEALLRTLRIGGWSRRNTLPLLLPLEPDFMKLLGLYAAEGNRTEVNHAIIVTATHPLIRQEVIRTAAHYGLHVHTTKSDIKITSRVFHSLIRRFQTGDSAEAKRATQFLYSLPEPHIKAFLRGYVDDAGDSLAGMTTCETGSPQLARDILATTSVLSLPSRLGATHRTYRSAPTNTIRAEKDGRPHEIHQISWQTIPVRDSRLQEIPNNDMQMSTLLKSALYSSSIGVKELANLCGEGVYDILHGKTSFVRQSTLARILPYLKPCAAADKLRRLVHGDIWFDRVVEVHECGIEPVYDIEVMPDERPIQNFISKSGICLHNTFRPERVKQIAEAQGMDQHAVLKNIRVARCFNSDHQMLLAEKVEDLIKKEHLPIKLVVVDSLMGHFRSDFVGRGQLADRQQKLNKHIHTLLRLATSYGLIVYVTNQVMARPDVFFGDPTEAIGGHVLAHGMTTRVYLRKGKKGTRVAKMIDSPYLPESEVAFVITDKGIRDVDP